MTKAAARVAIYRVVNDLLDAIIDNVVEAVSNRKTTKKKTATQ
jgi:hypothetical protein